MNWRRLFHDTATPLFSSRFLFGCRGSVVLSCHRLHEVKEYLLPQFIWLFPAQILCCLVKRFLDRNRAESHVQGTRIAARRRNEPKLIASLGIRKLADEEAVRQRELPMPCLRVDEALGVLRNLAPHEVDVARARLFHGLLKRGLPYLVEPVDGQSMACGSLSRSRLSTSLPKTFAGPFRASHCFVESFSNLLAMSDPLARFSPHAKRRYPRS